MFDQTDTATREISRLTSVLFVAHFWQDIPILGPDGVLFNLDTKSLDVDRKTAFKINGVEQLGGVKTLNRMRLLPVTTTQRAVINNREGFSITNMMLGDTEGFGSMMASSMKSNVKGEFTYPDEKVVDMVYTFGKFGLIGVNCMKASSPAEVARCQEIFKIVMSGLNDKTLLQDVPEYFGETSLYLTDKRPAWFEFTASKAIENAFNGGDLDTSEYEVAEKLIAELGDSAMAAHAAALEMETGILPGTRDAIATSQKRSYDKCDQWLMGQFPSFPMDTELEKSQKQLMIALKGGGNETDSDEVEDLRRQNRELAQQLQQESQRNDDFDKRMKALEASASAGTPTPIAPAQEPAATA